MFEAGFKFTVWLRLTRYLYLRKNPLLYLVRFILKHYSYKYSFDVSYKAQIGVGLTIAHYGYLIVPSNSYIGSYCTLRPGVVFGKKLSEAQNGVVVGNHVDFGVGSKVIGQVTIGDNVLVGANAVITKDVPSDVIVAGIPAKVLKQRTEA